MISAHGLRAQNADQFSMAVVTGTMGAGVGANSEIFQFRWTSTSTLCIVKKVLVSAGNVATAFTAGLTKMDLMFARAWTAAGTGGGTATITTNNAKLKTSFATTGVGEIRVATTAALGAGTKTLDAQALDAICHSVAAVEGTPVIPRTTLWDASKEDEYPLILAAEEGLVVRATVPATGTWTGAVAIRWLEIKPY